jgi:integral membrane sensor domain MASE1
VRILLGILGICAAYVALGAVSAYFAYADTDAWTVWLASGLTLGLLLSRPRPQWPAIVAGAALGATLFGLLSASGVPRSLAYGAIEAGSALAGAWAAGRLAALPMRLESPRELAALAAGGALVLAVTGGFVVAVWNVLTHETAGGFTFRVWTISSAAGCLLIAPLIVSWQQFRVKRSGGLPMPAFVGGAVAAALFVGGVVLVFSADAGGSPIDDLAYLPLLFLALVALLWGVRGASLAALAGALAALAFTVQGRGPFAGVEGFLGDAVLEVQGYAVAIALTGLLIAVLAAGQRNALAAAREWQTRFEAAIGAHRLLAYEWDPASGRLVLTGDARALLGVAPGKLATLADWLALVAPDARERVRAQFDRRTDGEGASDVCTYALVAPGGAKLDATDEARAIRDHDGTLHRVVGIVRFGAPAAA